MGIKSFISSDSIRRMLRAVRDNAPISRTRIAEITETAPAAVTHAVKSLVDEGIVIEEPLADTQGSRRKTGLMLNPQYGHVISVEYTSEVLDGVAMHFGYGVVHKKTRKCSLNDMSKAKGIERIVDFITELKNEISMGTPLLGIALVAPGIVDEENGIAIMSSIMPDWDKVPLAHIIEDNFGTPAMVINSMNAAIRCIDRFETDGVVDDLIYVEYGTGIACGLKLAGQYVNGHAGRVGELGHIRVTDNNVLCTCGGVGCLESLSSLPVLKEKAELAIVRHVSSRIRCGHNTTGIEVLEAAAEGDRLATSIVTEAFEYLARAIAGVINILDPEVVVLDSTIAKAGTAMTDQLMRTIAQYTIGSFDRTFNLRISGLASHVGSIGGGVDALNRIIGS